MKVKANGTYKNAYEQVLFLIGKTYKVIDESDRSYVVLNELQSETIVRKNRIGKDFEIIN